MAINPREQRIPSSSTRIQDFGLNVRPRPVNRNRRLVVLGTAEDGPMWEPIQIDKPEDAEFVWGRQGRGDLVRGIYEAWDVQTGYPTVVGVRIGNGKKAALEIEESTGSGDDEEQSGDKTALKLEALYPGRLYNNCTIGYDDNRRVSIYNEKTGLTSTFTVDTEHPNNTNVDVHNVAELVDAVNNDANLSTSLVASYSGLLADYEIAISGLSTDALVSNSDVSVGINLGDALENGYVTTDGYMVSNPINSGQTSSNNIIEVEAIEAVGTSEWEQLEMAGTSTAKFDIMPLDGKSPATWQTVQALMDYDDDSVYEHDPSGNVVSEYLYSVDNAWIDGGGGEGAPTLSGGYYESGSATNKLKLTVPLCPDDSEEPSNSGIAQSTIEGDANLLAYHGNWRYATCSGIETKEVDGVQVRPSGLIEVQVGSSDDPNDFWQTLPYSPDSGIYLESFSDGIATFGVGPNASGNPIMQSLVDSDTNQIMEGVYVRVSCNTIKGNLVEKENLNALNTNTSDLTQYFVRGQEIVFNTVPSFDLIMNYGTRISYEIGSNVDLTDPNEGTFTFNDPDLLPGPGGGALQDDQISYIRFRYRFMPNWPNITTATKSLSGGTDGANLSGRERKEALATAYENLRNYNANIWVPMGAFIDEITERYNPVTGLKEQINVDYSNDLSDFLEDLSINGLQPHAVLGVKPIETVTEKSKNEWVKKLTEVNVEEPTRGANVMNLLEDKFMSVAAFEPLFLNIGRGRSYVANGQAAYAGMLASTRYDISPTNKPINGITRTRYSLSVSQLEALTSSRYVTMKQPTIGDPVIVTDVTAAPPGSDFVNWSTFSITAEASDRVWRINQVFIGRQNTVEVRTSLEQQISNALMSMSGLRAFDFSLKSTANQQVLGTIEVDLLLAPVFTIKNIRTTVKNRKNLPVG